MEYIKCKFCSWTTKRAYKNKKGKFIRGIERLEYHVVKQHSDKYLDIIGQHQAKVELGE